MNILKVIHGYPRRYNAGSEVYTQTLCHGLAARHQVHVFTREEDPFAPDYRVRVEGDPDDRRVTVHLVNNPRNRDRYRVEEIDQRFADVLAQTRADVVHVGHLNHLSTSLLARAASRGVPIVFTLHDYWLMCPRGQFMQTFSEDRDDLWAACDGQEDHHIDPSGAAAFDERFAWCGNFQEGRCATRLRDGAYVHISATGGTVPTRAWRYVGDYRDGHGDDGRSSHVDLDGALSHDRWFLDLDVFHKGFARAKDESGWSHIDKAGRSVYQRRFASVEPFYNGQARVERLDGALEVIDETGNTVVQLRQPLTSTFQAASSALVGFWKTETLAAACRSQVFDALPATTAEVFRTCSLPQDRAARLLDALGELRMVEQHAGHWRPTESGEFLRESHPPSLAGAALEYAGPLRSSWAHLDWALRGAAGGEPNVFRAIASDPARLPTHHRMLESYARHDYAELVPHLPIGPGDQVLDAGGGTGALASLIEARFSDATVTVGDLPEVVAAGSKARSAVALDLFSRWPLVCDVVVLARVLHDWDDEHASRILANAKAALRPEGRLAIIELVRPDDGFAGALSDLHLLAVTGGKERRRSEWSTLLHASGFEVQEVLHGSGVPSPITARPTLGGDARLGRCRTGLSLKVRHGGSLRSCSIALAGRASK